MNKLFENKEYRKWLIEIKSKIKNRQIKAALKVNSELVSLYWEIGAMISRKQKLTKWGSGFISQLSSDLCSFFPGMGGFSEYNLRMCKRFYLFYGQKSDDNQEQVVPKFADGSTEKWEQLVPKIPWGHHILILKKIKNTKEAIFYVTETIENNWSRSILEYQIGTNLYKRQGKSVSNFKQSLPQADGNLVQQLLKDPYHFDFLTLSKKAKEKELEQKLIDHISQFLLELGKGFAYMGRQFKLTVGKKVFKTDLLFYHTRLKAYVVIELKMTEFEPEFIGKLNFYITAINEMVKDERDKPTIGILLCKDKDNFVVDFSLKDVNKPIGVSEFTYKELPKEIKTELPSEQEFNIQLKRLGDETNYDEKEVLGVR